MSKLSYARDVEKKLVLLIGDFLQNASITETSLVSCWKRQDKQECEDFYSSFLICLWYLQIQL